MLYSSGTLAITSGSNLLVGTTTNWNSTVCIVGDSICVGGCPTSFGITAVLSSTAIRVDSLMSTSASGLTYTITRDYTPKMSIPEVWEYDRDWPFHYTTAAQAINSYMTTITSVRKANINSTYKSGGCFGIGLTMELKSVDGLAFGDLVKWTTSTESGVGAAMESVEITTTVATEMACAMYIGNQPVSPNGIGTFLFRGFVRNDLWSFNDIGQPIYVAVEGGITQTAQTASYYTQTVGSALSRDSMLFDPDFYLS